MMRRTRPTKEEGVNGVIRRRRRTIIPVDPNVADKQIGMLHAVALNGSNGGGGGRERRRISRHIKHAQSQRTHGKM